MTTCLSKLSFLLPVLCSSKTPSAIHFLQALTLFNYWKRKGWKWTYSTYAISFCMLMLFLLLLLNVIEDFCTKIKLNKCNLTPRDEWSCSDCIFLMFFTHLASCLKNNLDYTLTGLCRKELFVLTCSMLYSFTMLHMQSNELRSKDLLASVDVIQYPTFPIG